MHDERVVLLMLAAAAHLVLAMPFESHMVRSGALTVSSSGSGSSSSTGESRTKRTRRLRARRCASLVDKSGVDVSLFVGAEWQDYRIGDVVTFGMLNATHQVEVPEAARHFWPPSSLLRRYLRRARSAADYSTFARLVMAHRLPAGAKHIRCALHLRLGDVAECDAASVDEMLSREVVSKRRDAPGPGCDYVSMRTASNSSGGIGGGGQGTARVLVGPKMLCEGQKYIRTREEWTLALERVGGPAACPEVHLVSGSKDDLGVFPKSLEYLRRLAHHLCMLGYTPRLRLAHSPDDDLAVFVRSRVFLSSGGGLSRLIDRLRDEPAVRAARWASDLVESLDESGGNGRALKTATNTDM